MITNILLHTLSQLENKKSSKLLSLWFTSCVLNRMTMEAYPSNYSLSKSAYLSQNPGGSKRMKPAYPFQPHSLLHSVRKPQAKPWKKAPVAPTPPRPVKVYKVDAMNFRELVQQLTGAPEFNPQPQSVARAAATSLDAAASPPIENLLHSTNWFNQGFQSETFGVKPQETTTDGVMAPSSHSNYWCSFLPLSPGTMTTLEQSRVL